MKTDTTAAKAAKGAILLGDDWFDSRTRMRSLISGGGVIRAACEQMTSAQPAARRRTFLVKSARDDQCFVSKERLSSVNASRKSHLSRAGGPKPLRRTPARSFSLGQRIR
jgi:hypothetical protein